MKVDLYTAAQRHLERQQRLLDDIDAFFREQEQQPRGRWSDETFSVKVRSSGFMVALRAARVVRSETCDAAEAVMRTERAKWRAPPRRRKRA